MNPLILKLAESSSLNAYEHVPKDIANSLKHLSAPVSTNHEYKTSTVHTSYSDLSEYFFLILVILLFYFILIKMNSLEHL